MLFNSYEFIFFFLPLALFVYYLISAHAHAHAHAHYHLSAIWLVSVSLFFYSWWNPAYLGLILFSILFNYNMGIALCNKHTNKFLLVFGIAINLGLLGYFKYANFFVANINAVFGSSYHLEHIILPLAISFFTFQQIAYLIDAFRKETREYSLLNYCLFVTFFPQLIAGPIVHHQEMMSQFSHDSTFRFNSGAMGMGLTLFGLGLFKKVILADGIAKYASPVFNAAADGKILTFIDAWIGTFAYTFQLYFDFSAYSDMAIGVGLMFGIRLPINFNSPYKATNIIDFWRRWHITLTRFLRDYVYISLGGNRNGTTRRYMNLMATMLLGGLWHGAGWTFVVWGGLHGLYLIVNHAWHILRRKLGHNLQKKTWIGSFLSATLTFIAVAVAWVFFRADHLDVAINMLSHMFVFQDNVHLSSNLFKDDILVILIWFVSLSLVVWLMPNLQQWMSYPSIARQDDKVTASQLRPSIEFMPTRGWAFFSATVMVIAILGMTRVSEFLYFQF